MSFETTSPRVVNTNSFHEEDLKTFLECSERIQQCERRQRCERPKTALKTREEIFETSSITEEDILRYNEIDVTQKSYSASVEDLLRYFEEDVEVDSDPHSEVRSPRMMSPKGEVIEEKSIRPSEVKQREMIPVNMRRDEDMKSGIIENVIKSYGAGRNIIKSDMVTKESGLKSKPSLPLSEIKTSDLKFIYFEPNNFKPKEGDVCLKPSELKVKMRQTSDITVSTAGGNRIPGNKPRSRFVKLSDLDKFSNMLSESEPYCPQPRSRALARSPSQSLNDHVQSDRELNGPQVKSPEGDSDREANILEEGDYPPNRVQPRNNFNRRFIKSDHANYRVLEAVRLKPVNSQNKPPNLKLHSNVTAKDFNLKPSDLNLTRKEWEQRYFQIMHGDRKPTNAIRNEISPSDLNLTPKQWEERYFQIMQNDLKPSAPSKPKRSQIPVKLEQSKNPYDLQSKWGKPLKSKSSLKSKVQKMADMFNGMISQMIKREQMGPYETLNNELSPEPKPPQPMARTRSLIKRAPIPSPRLSKRSPNEEAGCLVPEEVFSQLSVKDKVLLYNKFMREMTRGNPEFSRNHCKVEPAPVNKSPPAKGDVITKKQESVKSLAKELEARMAFPKHTPSESAPGNSLVRTPSRKGPAPQPPVQPLQMEEDLDEDQIHVSTLTVVLKPSPGRPGSEEKSKTNGVTDLRKKSPSPIVDLCPPVKRTNNQLCSSIPIDMYAPPRKIRRTRPERRDSKNFFKSPEMENLFYEWMSQRHGVSFDIHTSEPDSPVTVLDQEDTEKTNETDTTLRNEELLVEPQIQAQRDQKEEESQEQVDTPFKSEASESDSSLMTLPSSKIQTDESQTDQCKEAPAEFEFLKPTRPPRKRKVKRTTLTWKKDASLVEKLPISTTDSDSDYKKQSIPPSEQVDQSKIKKPLFKTPSPVLQKTPKQQNFEPDEAFLDFMNSPRRVRNAYTLTVMSSPSLQNAPSISSKISEGTPAKPPRKTRTTPSPQLPHEIDESKFENEDLGFETASNEYSPIRVTKRSTKTESPIPAFEMSPLFIKLNAELERRMSEVKMSEANQNPSAYSTPVKDNLNNSRNKSTPVKKSTWSTSFSPIQMNSTRRRSPTESDSRRSSILMDVIREENSNHDQQPTNIDSPDLDDDVFNQSNDTPADKSSSFWISVGDFTISMRIFENSLDRLNLLHDIFSQKSAECREVRFGIDDFKYSLKDGITKEEITKNLQKVDGVSHFWFASGDLAVPFQGNYMSPEIIEKVFLFIRDSTSNDTQLSFGVDNFDFSKISDPFHTGPKLSIESSYSMLIGLNGQANNKRNKFNWPNASQNSAAQKTSDFDPSEFDSDGLDYSEIGRLSFSPYGSNYFDMVSMRSEERSSVASIGSMGSPEMFSFEYENEPLDKMFKNKKLSSETFDVGKAERSIPRRLSSKRSMTVEEMIETIRQQQSKLQNIENEMKSYTNPGGLTSTMLDKYKNGTHIKKLQNIIKSISIIGKSGFANCTPQQLESFLYFLTLYAETCVSTCSEHMQKILDKLLDQTPVAV